jgi:hypothetical protein
MTGRAKWDAWSSAGRTFVQREDAERRYLEIARKLGWAEDMVIQEPKDEVTLSDTWEEDDSAKSSSNSGAGSRGMGGAVSAMLPPVQEPDQSIHGYAITNDVSALSTLLESNPTTNVDELDEFVSSVLFCMFCSQVYRDIPPFILHATGGTLLLFRCSSTKALTLRSRWDLTWSNTTDRISIVTHTQDPDGFSASELARVAGHEDVQKYLVLPP